MTDPKTEAAGVSASPDDNGPEVARQDIANAGPGSGERDFGDSAGYGTGGSSLDYRDVVGEDSVIGHRPNPLDAVMNTGTPEGVDHLRGRQDASTPSSPRFQQALHRTEAVGARWAGPGGPQRTGPIVGLALLVASLGLVAWSRRAGRSPRSSDFRRG